MQLTFVELHVSVLQGRSNIIIPESVHVGRVYYRNTVKGEQTHKNGIRGGGGGGGGMNLYINTRIFKFQWGQTNLGEELFRERNKPCTYLLIILAFFHRQSASCTHVSALLHALVALTPIQFTAPSSSDPLVDAEESTDSLPITSYPCVWKAPKKRKQSNLKMADADFEKHVYGRTASAKKRRRLEDFDPRPLKYRGKANDQLTSFLEHVRGKGLGISLLKDESTRYWSSDRMTTSTHDLPSNLELKRSVEEFMKCLSVNEDKAREIERTTRQQRNSIEWFTVRRFRITSSTFGEIYHRRPETPPTALVVRLLQQRQVVSPAIQWGVQQEAVALQAYVDYQHDNGHTGLTVCGVGFHVSISHPFLGASPDGGVYDPSCTGEPYGFLEIKCPYSHRNSTPEEACESSTFCCSLETVGDTKEIRLRTSHKYYCQVQGQMGVGSRPWCDFVVYTKKSISVQRIRFDSKFWNDHLVPKLEEFYTKCLAPEIVSPVHTLGLPVRDLRKQ